MTRKERFSNIIEHFSDKMPDAKTELIYDNPYQLLVAVILSAQCTDKRINLVTPQFFLKFPDTQTLACANFSEVFESIKSVSYPNNKSKHLIGMAQGIEKKFEGQIPQTVEELLTLPGVGRKTANVITSVLFNQPNMAVDTHVFRVSHRLSLVSKKSNTPLKVELELIKYLPKEIIFKAHHWLILHGRYVCKAVNPLCHECALQTICTYQSY